MGERREIYSEKLVAGSRTYFFDIKETSEGTKYLTITELGKGDDKYPHRIMVFEEHLEAFSEMFNNIIEHLESLTGSHLTQKPHKNGESFEDASSEKAYDLDEIRQKYPNAYMPWTEKDDERLADEFHLGKTNSELAEIFQRKQSGIISRLKKIGLI